MIMGCYVSELGRFFLVLELEKRKKKSPLRRLLLIGLVLVDYNWKLDRICWFTDWGTYKKKFLEE